MYLLLGTDWCSNCRIVKQQLKDLDVEFKYINLDDKPGYMDKYIVDEIPTVIKLENDEVVDRWIVENGSLSLWIQGKLYS